MGDTQAGSDGCSSAQGCKNSAMTVHNITVIPSHFMLSTSLLSTRVFDWSDSIAVCTDVANSLGKFIFGRLLAAQIL